MQNFIHLLPSLAAGNGASISTPGPGGTPGRGQGSGQGGIGLGDQTSRSVDPDLAPPVVRQMVPCVVDDRDCVHSREVRKIGIVVFVGRYYPMKAESWIKIVEKASRSMSVTHHDKARLATCML